MAVTKKPAPKKAQLNQKTGKKGVKGGKIRGKGSKRKINLRFVIDCTHPAEDNILDVGNFEKYLKERVKVEGKTNNLGNHVVIARDKTKVAINADIPFSKRYLKYLTKRYLKKNNLRDWLRVVASEHDAYELRYFNINADSDNEDNED
ncbi:60S ribosomal protein L22 [Galleria mellonella]|uniref:Large ribosomal subunit protein eL22 n=1 Tax=Galleria mellonella TaxID=7137 RepID=A0A3G1T1P8_GALME|nr:60S ribosomal protein L22 [Galleria mellonella]AXY94904.1 60S ribosomal protein L22 [Galleria mellonella]